MEVAGFGIYNFDRLKEQKNSIKIIAKFEMNENIENEAFQISTVYGIPGDGKSVIKIKPSEMDEFYLDPMDSNFRFLTVLPDNKIGIFAAWQYSNIDFDKLASTEDPTYTFVMNVQPQTIGSENDLNHVLDLARNN